MKTLKLLLCALPLTAAALLAQPDDRNGPPAGGQPGNGQRGHRPPPSPLMLALDTNHDGILSAAEIANAPKALLTLDKNHDGQLTQDELRPPRPAGGKPGEGPGDLPPPPEGK